MRSPQRVVTFGEVMLRLKSPGLDRLFQTAVTTDKSCLRG